MITHTHWCNSHNGGECDCGSYDQGIPIGRDPLSEVVCVPIGLLRRVELALLLATTEYSVKVMPTPMFNEMKKLANEIKEITNG